MRICITSKGTDPQDPVEERFGRSPYFLIIDQKTGKWTAVTNPVAADVGGVGPRAAQLLVDNDVSVVITGNVGGNARTALESAGIDVFLVREAATAASAYELYQKGSLQPLF
ncbi:MAG: dinitrogenase iron-molybdenum cofactor biosynthesis protein [Methanoculleus sp. SDB]|nr:MAG: dinitrogenase iron-molybdenum cofactor biosynthesis protein [Methanoculleus sp. SDB]